MTSALPVEISVPPPLLRHDIAGVPVRALAEQFGTPLYVYDQAPIERRIADLAPFDVIRYAQKANSNLALLDLMRRRGVLVDTVSVGEIHRALKAGYQPGGEPPRIVYTADIFDRESLEWVLQRGIHVNAGSPDMIDQLGARAPGCNLTLRINPGFGHGHSQKTNTGGEQSKHGIWHAQIDDCLRRADRHGLGITGLHVHIGSGTDFEHLAQVCGALESAAHAVGRTVRSVSVGGGLPIPYRAGIPYIDIGRYFALCDAARKRLEQKFGHRVSLEVEPGRYLVAESGYLICEIRAIKEMGANTFYLVDAGFNALARPIMYGAYHPISIAPRDGSRQRATQRVVVGGPLCESGDIFTQEEGGFVSQRELAAAEVGDWLILEIAGAYGFVMASNYNSKPLPAEVLVREGAPQLIRARQSLDDLVAGEVIPA